MKTLKQLAAQMIAMETLNEPGLKTLRKSDTTQYPAVFQNDNRKKIKEVFGFDLTPNPEVDGKWFVSISLDEYLHQDGKVRTTVRNEKDEPTGFYDTKEEASAALAAWQVKQK